MATSETHYEKIDTPSKLDAIWSSGFLLERRVAKLLQKNGFKALTNRGFFDAEDNKSKEYDVYAYKEIEVYAGQDSCGIYPTLVCECKNNSQSIAFFIQDEGQFEPLIDEIRVSGIPSKIWQGNKYISIQEFIKTGDFHHYCKPVAPVASQCCTFEKKAGHISATHNQELNADYRKITRALENTIDDDFKHMMQWFNPEDLAKEFIDLSFYYPVVIYQGDIDAVYVGTVDQPNKDDLVIKPCDHIQYNSEYFSPYENEVISYHIDIINEKYLETYIKLIEGEMSKAVRVFNEEKSTVMRSVDKIVGECQSLEKQPKIFRKHLEFQF